MKSHWNYLKHLIFSLSLVVTSSTLPSLAFAQVDTSLDQQKADCAKNSAAQWSATMNRCVGTVEAKQTRDDSKACNAIADLTQRAECHKKLAEQKTGLNSDPNSLNQGNTGKSAIMNGVGSAYAILGYFNVFASKKTQSPCMSKKIFGVTALAGTVSDFYLKARAKAKVNELTNKYQLGVKTGAYDAQVKALEYLKDEQNTVADIANMEKKRNMLLMMGYGAATIMAIYEMTPMGANAACTKKDKDKEQDCKENPAQDKCKTEEKTCEQDSTQDKCKKPDEKTCDEDSTQEKCKKPEEKTCEQDSTQEKCKKIADKCPEGQTGTPPSCQTPTNLVTCSNGASVSDDKQCPPPAPPKQETPSCESATPPSTCAAPKKEATMNTSERVVNGEKKAYYNTTIDGKKYDIVDNKLYPSGGKSPVGTLNYSSGEITMNSGGPSIQITKVTGANTSWVPNSDTGILGVHNKMSPKIK